MIGAKKASTGVGIALMLVTSLFATLVLVNDVGVPQPVEAIQGIVPNVPLGVDLTETLTSLDLNDDGDADDSGEVREVSGYVFTVQSDASFTPSSVMTVTFPPGIDLLGADEAVENYRLYDPNDPVEESFEAATKVKVFPSSDSEPFKGGFIELTFGTLAPPGLQPGVLPGVRGENITVRIEASAIPLLPVA